LPSTTVNPTRQELTRLKNRLRTSIRGHKLLKDKRDELMKQFMDVVRENRALRKRVEEGLMRAHGSFTVAAALMSPEMLEQSLLYPKQSVELDMSFQNIMSVDVPRYHFKTKSQDPGEVYPYGFAQTSGELDDAVDAMSQVFADMLKLAEVEKTSQLLAQDKAHDHQAEQAEDQRHAKRAGGDLSGCDQPLQLFQNRSHPCASFPFAEAVTSPSTCLRISETAWMASSTSPTNRQSFTGQVGAAHTE